MDPQAARPHALVLHDDPRMARHVCDVLEAAGLTPHAADSVYRVLAPQRPDVALVVLGATAVDERDLEVVALVREGARDATVLMTFPPNMRERAARALELGADATLPEPFYPAELGAHAARAVARFRHLRSAPAGTASAAPQGTGTEEGAIEGVAVGVAHSIRNPLQILELMLATAEEGDELDIAAMRRLMARMAGVVEDLTRFGSRTRVDTVDVPLPTVLAEIFAPSRKRGAPHFEVTTTGDADALTVRAVPNLLRSALAAARDRAMRVTHREGLIEVGAARVGDLVEVRIADGGPTLGADERARFFLPDPDMDAVQAGTWLEMAALAGMIRNQGGSTDVLPGDENGSVVVIRLPASHAAGGGGPTA